VQRLDSTKETVDRLISVKQLQHMCDKAAALDGIDEAGRRFVMPVLNHARSWEAVKGEVDLDGRKASGIELEVTSFRNARWIKGALPAPIRPTARADVRSLHRLLSCRFQACPTGRNAPTSGRIKP